MNALCYTCVTCQIYADTDLEIFSMLDTAFRNCCSKGLV